MSHLTNHLVAGPELNAAVARILGYTIYHYDKDVAENCYYQLMDPDFNPVVVHVRQWGRKTEAEAWADAPDFSGYDLDARQQILDFVEQRGIKTRFLMQLREQRFTETPLSSITIIWGLLTAENIDYCRALLLVEDRSATEVEQA